MTLDGVVGKILLVDDEKTALTVCKNAFEKENFQVDIAMNGFQALKLLKDNEYDAIITDYKMPDINGLELMDEINDLYPLTNVILLTGHSDQELASEASKRKAYDFLTKPASLDDLIETVKGAVISSQQTREMIKPKDKKNYGLEIREKIEARARELSERAEGIDDDDRWYRAENDILDKSMILLVSDRQEVCSPLEEKLKNDFNIVVAENSSTARKKLAYEPYDLLIADMPYSKKITRRLNLLLEVKERMSIPIVVVSTNYRQAPIELLIKTSFDGLSKVPFDDIGDICIDALKRYRESDEPSKDSGKSMASTAIDEYDFNGHEEEMKQNLRIAHIFAALNLNGDVEYADNALEELTQNQKYAPVDLIATHKLIDLDPPTDQNEEQIREALGLGKNIRWVAKFFGDKTKNCQIEYEVLDNYEKRNKLVFNATHIKAVNSLNFNKVKNWDEEVGIHNMKLRDVAYYSELPHINILRKFPIRYDNKMKRYILLERLGGAEEFQPDKKDRSFTAINLNNALKKDDECFARHVRLYIKFKENELMADLQENPILFSKDLRHEISVRENMEEDILGIMEHYGLSEEEKKNIDFCCSLFDEFISHRYAQVRDASWRNMMFRKPASVKIRTIDDLTNYLRACYLSNGVYYLYSEIDNNLVQIDFDKINRLSLETEDTRRVDLGEDQLIADYHYILHHIKFTALNLFKSGQDEYWKMVYDTNHIIAVVEDIDFKKDYSDAMEQARSFIDAHLDSELFPYQSFEQWKEEADYIGILYRSTRRMNRMIHKKRGSITDDVGRVRNLLLNLIENENEKLDDIPEELVEAEIYEAVEGRLEILNKCIKDPKLAERDFSRLLKLEYLNAVYEKIENKSIKLP